MVTIVSTFLPIRFSISTFFYRLFILWTNELNGIILFVLTNVLLFIICTLNVSVNATRLLKMSYMRSHGQKMGAIFHKLIYFLFLSGNLPGMKQVNWKMWNQLFSECSFFSQLSHTATTQHSFVWKAMCCAGKLSIAKHTRSDFA